MNIHRVLILSAFMANGSFLSLAQQAANHREAADQRAGGDAAASASQVPGSASPQTQESVQPTVEQQIEMLKTRIDELERLVKSSRANEATESADAERLKAAEKELVPAAVSLAATSSSTAVGLIAPVQNAAAAAPAKEISSQTTTEGEPFEGD